MVVTNNNLQVVVELGKFDDDHFETNHYVRFIKSNGNRCSFIG